MKIFKATVWYKIFQQDEYTISAPNEEIADNIACDLAEGYTPEECTEFVSGIVVKFEGRTANENSSDYEIEEQ